MLSAQDCANFPNFQATATSEVNWNAYPTFNLPFQIIYGASIQNSATELPLSHGFSHISHPDYLSSVPVKNRALLYYNTAVVNAMQPWEMLRSPWENNMGLYQNKWKIDHKNLSISTGNLQKIDADILAFDIERVWRFDYEILQFKRDSSAPMKYLALSDEDFLKQYKKDLRTLYDLSVESVTSKGLAAQTQISSYSDTPIVNTFSNIQGNSWEEWINDEDNLNFICQNESGAVGGAFYEQLNFIAPSAYYYYDYPHAFAGEYLSYLLFQIEANRAWSDKPIIPFVWLRYSQNIELENKFIKPWMAEATAIFPFFSGASGLWLWENPALIEGETDMSSYEYFIKGLYRLSQFKHFFEGEYSLVAEISAREYNENKQAIWRGVVKGQEILIAAHNPFASSADEEVSIRVNYGNWSSIISLKGYEVKLCAYDMSILATEEKQDFIVFPNPTKETVNVRFWSESASPSEVKIVDELGKQLTNFTKNVDKGNNEWVIILPNYQGRQLFLQIQLKKQLLTKKISLVD